MQHWSSQRIATSSGVVGLRNVPNLTLGWHLFFLTQRSKILVIYLNYKWFYVIYLAEHDGLVMSEWNYGVIYASCDMLLITYTWSMGFSFKSQFNCLEKKVLSRGPKFCPNVLSGAAFHPVCNIVRHPWVLNLPQGHIGQGSNISTP